MTAQKNLGVAGARRARAQLLHGASLLVFAAFGGTAWGQVASLRGATSLPAATGAGAPSVAVPVVPGLSTGGQTAAQQAAAARALQNASRAQQAVTLAAQAQAAARQASGGATVPNGLAHGGLAPVANPTSNNAGSGLSLWTGANLPTQTTKADGSIQVDVKQTASRAVLSWETFNVGAQTTLNFDQSQNGVAKPDWVVLNRVVGQLDPATGRRTDQAPAPSQILGSIKAQGTVLVINQNGVIFGKNAQINTGSLLASTLEIGRQTRVLNGATQSLSLADRNEEFLNFGLLGAASQVAAGQAAADTLSAQQINVITNESRLEGAITVEAGAQITSSAGGFVILAGPKITNAGTLTADRGQVSLAAGRTVRLEASTGAAGTATPDIRGLKVSTSVDNAYASALYVENKGVIQSSEGYASLMAARGGAVINSGIIIATTSVARNGYVELQGGQIRLAPTSIIAITPDDDGTIPQDFKSLSDFKTSRITIGDATSSVEMASGSLIYAPSAKVGVGAAPGIDTTYLDQAGNTSEGSRIFIDSGATIDVAGLKNVLISASRNSVTISPVKGNELADTPALRNSFLRGATLYLDPRLSGVRDDGFAWIGSPLVSAASYAQQVGITASELMTKGGDVTLGTAVTRNSSGVAKAPDVIIKKGAQIDISGGWVNYQGGMVRTTKLVDISGAIVDISQADPNGVYVGIYSGFVHDQPRFNEVRTYANPLLTGARYQDGYSEGRDAGALTIKTSQPLLEGTVYADAFPGLVQRQDAQLGTGATTVYGDKRRVQAAPSQLPVGGLLSIQELGLVNGTSTVSGGGDIRIVDGESPTLANGLRFGQSVSIDNSGNLLIPVRPEDSLPSLDTRKTLTLGADTLAQMGLGQLNLTTSGSLTVERDAEVVLSPGGVFSAATGGRITVDGSIAAASGLIDLTTYGMGSIFEAVTPKPGDYDIVVNGSLSTAGLWINDYGASGEALRGSAYTGGGKVSLNVAARKLLYPATTSSASAPETNVDLSGSILLDGEHSLIDVSSGGYVTSNGGLMLTARGGDVSLTNDTTYFQIGYNPTGTPEAGGWPGIRLDGPPTTVNPGSMDAKVSIGRGAIRAHGFGGGGTFSLTTPAIAFGEGRALTGTNLGLEFFSQSGFAAYDIKSYGTSLTPNTLSGLGGYNAVLSTQTLTIGNGQSLNLTQSRYSIRPTTAQTAALIALRTGGRVSDVLTAATPSEAWDQLGVNLTFGGLVELKVAQGGQIIGAPGSTIGASKILNQGLIRLHGGKVVQSATLPAFYAGATTFPVTAARSLSEIFSTRADGSVDPNAISRIDPTRTNAQVARGAVYLLGELDADVGMRLDAGSVTDLSGISIRNPYASAVTDGRQVVTGRLWNGGTLQTATARSLIGTIVGVTPAIGGVSPYTNSDTQPNLREDTVGLALDAAAGAVIDLSGASDVYDQPSAFGNYAPATQWSNGGVLNMGAGGNIAGATIRADGGSAQAAGGVLALPDLVLTSDTSAAPTRNTLTAQAIEAAGFDTLVVQGSLRGEGDVDLKLGSAFYLTSKTWDGVTSLNDATYRQSLSPVIGANGSLRIKAAYVSLGGAFQSLATPNVGAPGAGEVVFDAGAMDVGGAVLFDRSVAWARFNVAGDLRFTGVAPYETAFAIPGAAPAPSLSGHLAVNGDLSLVAGQIYATTGSTYAVTSTAGDGLIAIGRSSATTPATPYSAGSNLSFQASSIVQGGVLRAPLGTLTLGAQSPLTRGGVQFAPATGSVILADGGLTSVSAGGLSIPYGVTTDQKEYYFSPTAADPLKGPPAGALNLAGRDIVTQGGAKIDLSGGGDVYAYEFIPGVGGSRDVLSQYNPDAFSGNGGYQYADKRQVYAIVPGLSDGGVAAFDPIYSSNYADLYSATAVGRRVYLSGGPGFAAGWYTLLPAQYATLPGGMRVVEESGLNAAPGLAQSGLDGSILVSGRFGGLNGQEDSALRMFTVQSQSVFRSYSNIALTSATLAFSDQALKAGTVAPRLPTDAARLTIQPVDSLTLAGTFDTTPAKGGRGAQADISGADIVIVSDVGAPIAGRIQLDADQLSNLNVDSLLIGGTRTDNADGTTTIKASASRITVSNDSGHALAAPDLLLAVDNGGAVIIDDGATVIARGATSDTRTGAYLLDGSATNLTGKGALVRVSNGAARTVARTNMDAGADTALLRVGAATLTGASVLLNSSRDLTIDPQANLSATDLGLSAAEMHFSETPEGLGGLVVTARLAKALGAAKRLTLSTPSVIDFAAGDYAFGDLVVDAGGLAVAPGDGSVKLTAGSLTLANAHAKLAGCVTACGAGTLAISTQNLAFGSGDLQVLGAGGGVSIAARDGFFYQGRGSLNVGSAALTISTPLIADRAAPIGSDGKAIIPSLALVSSGAVSILGGGAAAAPEGVAGASLTIDGATISVAQTRIRASAGVLKLTARDDLTIGAGAILATPGYVKSFGDAADPYLVYASGGALTLTSVNGDIDLAEGSTLSVGGGMGEAGDLTLNAANGSVRFAGALEANAPGKGAGFFLNQGGAFDLARFQAVTGGAFTGHVAIRTGTGDLALAAGQTLKADNVFLTADGGRIDLAGAIDVSGVNGGDVRLIGADGVLLRTGSKIDARAEGYGDDATRVAEGGSVLVGTRGNGAIRVEAGAAIDVGAARGQARLVETRENGVTNYRLVEADRGGSLTLRAPVVEAGGLQTVNVSFAGAVTGADSVTVEGYKAYDLGEIAVGGQFSGVTISNGVATLDLAATGKPNFLADTTAGTLADFIRRFDISAAYGQLGGLASAANFHARPGVELNYAGDVVLSSNWNLAAGVVNVSGAVSARLMALHPSLAGAYYVKLGSEGALLADYTDMTYRVGGKASGEAGVLTLRAGGDLTLKGSITDGYFTFGDQTDPAYLNTVLGGGSKVYNGSVNGACVGSCATIGAYTPTGSPTNVISVTFPGASALSSQLVASGNPAPYRAAANSAAALGSGLNGAGDAVASADLFPLIETASGQRAVHSSSYQLVAGAARDNSGAFSADPTRTQAGSDASLSLDGRGAYSYGGVAGTTAFSDTLLFGTANGQRVTAEAWLQAQLAANPAFTVNSYTRITFSAAPAAVSAFLSQNARAYFAQFPGRYTLTGPANAPTSVSTTLELAAGFLKLSANSWSTLKTSYTPPRPTAAPPLTTVQTAALIRTGTGSIELSTAGAIDLRNGQDAVYRNLTTGAVTSATSGYQVGGAAVYTAGHRVLPRQVLVADPATGEILQLDPTAYSQPDPRLTNYGYGAGSGGGAGLAGLLEAETVYAEGGGDVSLTAGGDILGRRDAYGAARIGANGNQLRDLAFVGSMTQPWRVGQVGEITDIRINNKLFAEGVGTLGGGDVMVAAGGQVVDLSIVADTSVTTADVGGRTGRALLTFGGGDVSIKVGGDLLGGRIDIGRGDGDIVVGGDIAAAGRTQFDAATPSALTDNSLRLRLTDAQIRIAALGDAAIQGITALGVGDINRIGFYSGDSGVSILAGGSVTVANPSLNTGVGDVVSNGGDPSSLIARAIYPTSFSAVALAGDLSLGSNTDRQILLYPSARGTLTLAAGGDVAATTIAMLDIDPGLTPGAFSSYRLVGNELVGGKPFAFPAVLPSTSLAERLQLHASSLPHAGDATPNRVHAGGDIDGMIISTPKLTRISAGQDIVDMMFFGQNLGSTDITRIVAGRDITATTTLRRAVVDYVNGAPVMGPLLPTLNGGAFVIGGPGHLFLEAGRDLGPFLNSATDVYNPLIQSNTQQAVFGGGVLSVGAEWNPWLGAQGASVVTAFGVAKGADYAGLRETYLNPANAANWPDHLYVNTPDSNDVLTPDKSKPIYAPLLSAWMQANHPDALPAGAADYAKTYAAFSSLPELQQRVFLLKVYYNELTQTSVPGPSYLKYSRGYTAVNTLFSAKLGYTANDLSGGSNGANQTVRTGDLDLRLSTIQTARGGDISILGPGGRVLAGSTVSTAQQAARRNYFGRDLFSGVVSNGLVPAQTSYLSEVPSGFEGVLTLRGGGVYTFTDGDFVLNQSRLFTEQGGDIAMWSSNGDLNAGQGPKTSANFPPAVVKVSDNAYAELDQANAVSGAGIAAFQPAPGVEAPNVYLIAPRGTVDAGDAGVRVAGNLFVAALSVANADNFSVQGSAIGVPTTSAAPTVSNEASAASSAAEKAAQATAQARPRDERSIISVQVLGFGDKECDDPARRDDKTCRP